MNTKKSQNPLIFLILIAAAVLLTSCSQNLGFEVSGDFQVMKVGDYIVSGDDYQYWVLPYKTYYESAYGSDYWETNTGKKLGRQLLDEINNYISDWYAMLSYADEIGFVIEPERLAEIEDNFQKDRLDQGDYYISFLLKSYLHEENAFRLGYFEPELHDAFTQYLLTEDTQFVVAEDEVKVYAQEENYVGAYQIMIKNDVGEEKDSNRKLAESVLEKLKMGSDFSELMLEYSESTTISNDIAGWTLSLDDENYAEYFRNSLAELKPEGFSDVILYEDDWQSWYVIFMRIEPDLTVVERALKEQKIDSALAAFSAKLNKEYCVDFEKLQMTDVKLTGDQ